VTVAPVKRQSSLSSRIFFLTLWSWLLVVDTVQYLQMPDLDRWDWGKFVSVLVIAVVAYFLAHNIADIVTGNYRREDAPKS
jgi:hypothetical protein